LITAQQLDINNVGKGGSKPITRVYGSLQHYMYALRARCAIVKSAAMIRVQNYASSRIKSDGC